MSLVFFYSFRLQKTVPVGWALTANNQLNNFDLFLLLLFFVVVIVITIVFVTVFFSSLSLSVPIFSRSLPTDKTNQLFYPQTTCTLLLLSNVNLPPFHFLTTTPPPPHPPPPSIPPSPPDNTHNQVAVRSLESQQGNVVRLAVLGNDGLVGLVQPRWWELVPCDSDASGRVGTARGESIVAHSQQQLQ